MAQLFPRFCIIKQRCFIFSFKLHTMWHKILVDTWNLNSWQFHGNYQIITDNDLIDNFHHFHAFLMKKNVFIALIHWINYFEHKHDINSLLYQLFLLSQPSRIGSRLLLPVELADIQTYKKTKHKIYVSKYYNIKCSHILLHNCMNTASVPMKILKEFIQQLFYWSPVNCWQIR